MALGTLPYKYQVTSTAANGSGFDVTIEIRDADGALKGTPTPYMGSHLLPSVLKTRIDDLVLKQAQDDAGGLSPLLSVLQSTYGGIGWVTGNSQPSGGSSAWVDITGKPSTFPPDTHAHAQADVTGLTTTLSGKAATSHTHVVADITDYSPSSVPTGAIVLIVSGTCASLGAGWTEETSLNGKFVLGTLAANADISTTGGSDTITTVLNHTHPVNVNDAGHSHTQRHFPTATGGSTGNTIDASMSGTQTNSGLSTASATTGITATTSNPAGGVASIDNRPSFLRVLFCRKT